MQHITLTSAIGSSIADELSTAKQALDHLKEPIVAIFGSARTQPASLTFSATEALAHAIASQNVHVLTGGGPGIMEAANRGAKGGPGLSIGLNIILPFETTGNPHQDVRLTFDRFAARKVVFAKYASAFVVMPGGVGTLDELFEIITLIQCQKTKEVPVILYDSLFWNGLLAWMQDQQLSRGLINQHDIQRLQVADTVEHTITLLKNAGIFA